MKKLEVVIQIADKLITQNEDSSLTNELMDVVVEQTKKHYRDNPDREGVKKLVDKLWLCLLKGDLKGSRRFGGWNYQFDELLDKHDLFLGSVLPLSLYLQHGIMSLFSDKTELTKNELLAKARLIYGKKEAEVRFTEMLKAMKYDLYIETTKGLNIRDYHKLVIKQKCPKTSESYNDVDINELINELFKDDSIESDELVGRKEEILKIYPKYDLKKINYKSREVA